MSRNRHVFVLTGPVQGGKTTSVPDLVSQLRKRGLKAMGSEKEEVGWDTFRRFFFNPDALNPPIPKTMQAIRQQNPDGGLVWESIPVPQPAKGEVLIRMAAAPINPSDLASLKGGYLKRSYPFTPGLEGSGVVVKSGGGLLAGLRSGKRVACTPLPDGDGTWAEYMITSAKRTIPLPHSVSLEQGAMTVVNPMTAMALMHMVKKGKHPAFVNNAAASSLGKMLIRLSTARAIPLINIVRNPSQLKTLKKLGARHVLNSQEDGFQSELGVLAKQLGASLFLDAVGGKHSNQLLEAAPPGSTLVNYARLSGDPLEVDPTHLIEEDITIRGFQLGNWLQTKSIPFKMAFLHQVKKQLGTALSSHISQTFTMKEAEKAIAHYSEDKSSGKVILIPKQN